MRLRVGRASWRCSAGFEKGSRAHWSSERSRRKVRVKRAWARTRVRQVWSWCAQVCGFGWRVKKGAKWYSEGRRKPVVGEVEGESERRAGWAEEVVDDGGGGSRDVRVAGCIAVLLECARWSRRLQKRGATRATRRCWPRPLSPSTSCRLQSSSTELLHPLLPRRAPTPPPTALPTTRTLISELPHLPSPTMADQPAQQPQSDPKGKGKQSPRATAMIVIGMAGSGKSPSCSSSSRPCSRRLALLRRGNEC